MKNKWILIIIVILVLIFAFSKIKNSKADKPEQPINNMPSEVRVQETQMQEVQTENTAPNALDYMAPGYQKSQERIRQVQELRQQALDEQEKDLDKIYNQE